MELKLGKCVNPQIIALACFNRTFMELKRVYTYDLAMFKVCFNRTFMELKHGIEKMIIILLLVLIGPSWN